MTSPGPSPRQSSWASSTKMTRNEIAGIERALPSAGACQAAERHITADDRCQPPERRALEQPDFIAIGLLQKVAAIHHRHIDESRVLHPPHGFGRCRECKLQRAL